MTESGRAFLFLDFDGVINVRDRCFDPVCVQALNKILESINCELIVSSSWRRYNCLDELNTFLSKAGVRRPASGMTPYEDDEYPNISRSQEIQSWLKKHLRDGDTYAILDDDEDPGELQDRWVMVNPNLGLTETDVQQAIQLMQRPPVPESPPKCQGGQ